MKQIRFKALGLLGLIVFLLAACATTQIKAVWKDYSYSSRPQRVMVIYVAKEPIYRRMYEDEFVSQLKARGTDAIASYTTLPDKSQDDQAAIASMVEQLGADAVLVSRLVSRRSVRVYYPATVSHRPNHYATWPEYYRHGYALINTPGYTTKYDYALMETNLYDVRNNTLVWAVTTETGADNLSQTVIKTYIATILKTMVDYGLLKT